MRVTRLGNIFAIRRKVKLIISLLNQQGENEYFPSQESVHFTALWVADFLKFSNHNVVDSSLRTCSQTWIIKHYFRENTAHF